ncbi:hypothetical protein [Tateyamaria sp.]|uniref:hypothetical protein n=1 Tax=Tateyamaria sp. TaxID=1929288 RepID=UPI0032A062E7
MIANETLAKVLSAQKLGCGIVVNSQAERLRVLGTARAFDLPSPNIKVRELPRETKPGDTADAGAGQGLFSL